MGAWRAAIVPIGRVAAVAMVVFSAAVAGSQLARLAPRFPSVVVAGSIFLLLVIALAPLVSRRTVHHEGSVAIAAALPVGAGVVALLSATGVAGLGDFRQSALLVVVYAAWVEESVFRRLLPRMLEPVMSPFRAPLSAALAVMVSQALFAAAHLLPISRFTRFDGPGAARLFAGGLLFSLIASRSGFIAAVITHALLNAHAIRGTATTPLHPTAVGTFMVAALALAATASLRHRPFLSHLPSRTRT